MKNHFVLGKFKEKELPECLAFAHRYLRFANKKYHSICYVKSPRQDKKNAKIIANLNLN